MRAEAAHFRLAPVLVALLSLAGISEVSAQTVQKPAPPPPTAKPAQPPAKKPAPPPPTSARPRERLGIRGLGMAGGITFAARESFDAVLGSPTGVVYGGGVQVTIPAGIYAEVAASRFRENGERVFVGPGEEVFQLGIPIRVTVLPLELTGGYRFRNLFRGAPGLVLHAGGGATFVRYEETADFAGSGDDIDERYTGFQVVGGAEYRLQRWVGVIGEVGWSSVPDALGESGASAAFDEDNLGGTTFRIKVVVGR